MRKVACLILALAAAGCNLLAVGTALPLPVDTATPILLASQQTASSTPEISLSTATSTETSGPTRTPYPTRIPAPTETPLPTLDMPYDDVSGLLQGVCFKYLASLDGQVLAFNSTGDLAGFFDSANQSKKCPELIARPPFDFSSKQIVGTVITAQGCGLILRYVRTDQDDTKRQRTLDFQATPAGNCPYILVEP